MAEHCDYVFELAPGSGITLSDNECICHRPVYKDDKCIFHHDSNDKQIDIFIGEIKNQIAIQNADFINCCGFIYPKGDLFVKIRTNKPLVMENCKFYGDVSFKGSTFERIVSFRGSEFFGKVYFGDKNESSSAKFGSDVIFREIIFHDQVSFHNCVTTRGTEFVDIKFLKGIYFTNAHFRMDRFNGLLRFDNCTFMESTLMDIDRGENLTGVLFNNCDLEGLEFLALPRQAFPDLRIDFVNIKKWHQRGILFRRNAIIDEILDKDKAVDVIDCYRYLEKYFYDHSDFNLARHFHIGQMVVMRRDKNYDRPSCLMNWLYQTISNYGESILRPLLSLIISLLIFPIFLCFTGIKVHENNDGMEYIANVNYSNIGDKIEESGLLNTYLSTFGANLSLSTFDRKSELSPHSDSLSKGILVLETVLNIIFASLIVIAVRRKFTPKAPQGE